MKYIEAPLTKDAAKALAAGDSVRISGVLYTARDAAHKRLYETLKRGEKLPFELDGAVIYYVGPTPAKEGEVIGSAGPTTSSRVDVYTPALLDAGMLGMIGKGGRGADVTESITRNGAVYFGAIGGAGALLSKCITKAEVIAYEDLGTEAVFRLEVTDFPVTVIIDSDGNNWYKLGRARYLESRESG